MTVATFVFLISAMWLPPGAVISPEGDRRDVAPFSIDGWEKNPAPLLDRWQLIAPLASLEDIEALASPVALAQLFPSTGSRARGRTWQAVDSNGHGVEVGETTLAPEQWALALAFINSAETRAAKLNLSCREVGEVHLYLDGRRIFESPGPARREGIELQLPKGWSRILVAMRGNGQRPTFFLQLAGSAGQALPVFSTERLTPSQQERFGEPASIRGTPWVTDRRRARRIFNDCYSVVWREIARMSHSMGGAADTEKGDVARRRLTILFDIGRLMARGGLPEALPVEIADAQRRFKALKGLAADDSAAATRISEGLLALKPWLKAPKKGLSSWHFLDGAIDREDLWKRFHLGRKLCVDLLEYGSKVVAESR